MRSKYPWSISLCIGNALQFLITDADGNVVFMGEMYEEDDLLALMSLFQRNPEIRVADPEDLAKKLQDHRHQNAKNYLDSLASRDAIRLLSENNYDVVKAAEAGKTEVFQAERDNAKIPT